MRSFPSRPWLYDSTRPTTKVHIWAARVAGRTRYTASGSGPGWSGSSPGSTHASRCRSVHCSASSTAEPADAHGRPAELVLSFDAPPPGPAFVDAALLTSSGTHTRVEMGREGGPLIVIRRQLGHSNLGITSVYLQGDRQRRNHRNGPCPTRPHDPCQRVAAKLAPGAASDSGVSTAVSQVSLAGTRKRSARLPRRRSGSR